MASGHVAVSAKRPSSKPLRPHVCIHSYHHSVTGVSRVELAEGLREFFRVSRQAFKFKRACEIRAKPTNTRSKLKSTAKSFASNSSEGCCPGHTWTNARTHPFCRRFRDLASIFTSLTKFVTSSCRSMPTIAAAISSNNIT